MYFDAVEEILKKLNNPSLKSAAKSNLQRELKDLDPEGVIQRFVRDGGPRPDISKIMGSKKLVLIPEISHFNMCVGINTIVHIFYIHVY